MLAALLDERDAALRHFEAALEMNARLGAQPALVRTEFEYARVLRASEPARANSLLRDVGSAAERLGMRALVQQARELLG